MTELKFTDVYLSNQFNPCPCGYFYGSNDLIALKEHFTKGHYQTQEPELKGQKNEEKG